jgi:tRNA-dihydrouridine synthase B
LNEYHSALFPHSNFTLFQGMAMIRIGPHKLPARAVLAPMAGITDLPFRRLCREFGAGLTMSEMLISDASLWQSRKSHLRLAHDDSGPRAVQIAGAEPAMMADAARRCAEMGADIIDINMGCPAKKSVNGRRDLPCCASQSWSSRLFVRW